MTETSTSYKHATDLERQTGNDLSGDTLAHKFGNFNEPITQTVSARQRFVHKMFLLTFFLTQGALAFPALLGRDFTVSSQWIVAVFISIVYCLVFHTLHRHVEGLHKSKVMLELENATLTDKCSDFEKLRTEHSDLIINYNALQAIDNNRQTEHEALQVAHDQLQTENANLERDYEEAQAVNTAVTAERDQFQTQLQDSRAASAERQTEYEQLQARNIDIAAERDQFRQRHEDSQTISNQYQRLYETVRTANVNLTAERDRLRASINGYRVALDNARRNVANITANFPDSAAFLFATPHQISPNIVLTKDGRPDRRYREGRNFRDFNSETSFVIHNGKRVCMMLTTVAEI